MQKIKIDLRNLTQAHLDEARGYMGKCDYRSPCIIGSLMTPAEREAVAKLADPHQQGAQDNVSVLIYSGFIQMPLEQHEDAMALQDAFDSSRWDDVVEIVSDYSKEPVA